MSRQNGDGQDNEIIILLVAILAIVTIFTIDWIYGPVLRRTLLAIYGAELWVLTFATKLFGYDYTEVVAYAMNAPGERVYWSDVIAVGTASNYWWRWIAIPAILALGWYVSRKMPGASYSGSLGLEKFISYQSRFWGYIRPYVAFNPARSKNPNDAPALSPKEFILQSTMVNGEPDETAVRNMLVKQLKTPWTKPENLPPHMKALYAAFALKCADDGDWDEKAKNPDSRKNIRQTVQTMQFDINDAFDPVKAEIDLEKLKPWLDKIFANNKIMSRAAARAKGHAYAETVLLSVLEFARLRGGVFAPAEFRWVKSIDRSLWYALDDSRPPKESLAAFSGTFHVEGAGIIAHWLAEKTFRAPIAEPFVDGALMSIIKWWKDNE